MAIKVSISEREYKWAEYAGVLRNEQAVEAGHRSIYGGLKNCIAVHKTGALGEFVASLAMGVSWRGPGIFNGEDINGYQVRTTRRSEGSLILRSKDNDEDKYILVTGTKSPLTWWVHDWIYARQGKIKVFSNNPNGRASAYFVDQAALRILKDLRM